MKANDVCRICSFQMEQSERIQCQSRGSSRDESVCVCMCVFVSVCAFVLVCVCTDAPGPQLIKWEMKLIEK